MTDLPPRKFVLNQFVWVRIGKETHSARVWGYEDGRNLHEKWNGWVYHVKVMGVDEEIIDDTRVREDQLQSIENGLIEQRG